jgi:hypothetical protein
MFCLAVLDININENINIGEVYNENHSSNGQ